MHPVVVQPSGSASSSLTSSNLPRRVMISWLCERCDGLGCRDCDSGAVPLSFPEEDSSSAGEMKERARLLG